MDIRDILEAQILADAKNGDTTVLYHLLEQLSDSDVYSALSKENREKVNDSGDTKVLLDCLDVIRSDSELLNEFKQRFGDLSDEHYYSQTVNLIKHRMIKASAIRLIKKLGKKDESENSKEA